MRRFKIQMGDMGPPPAQGLSQGLQKTGMIMLAVIQDLVSVQMIVYHWVVALSLLILSSSSFLINIILELWMAAKRKPAYVAYITAMIFLQIILHSIVHIYDFHIFIISCVYNEPIQWPARSWLASLIGRALHQYRRGQEFESRTSLSFFQAFLSQLHKLRI